MSAQRSLGSNDRGVDDPRPAGDRLQPPAATRSRSPEALARTRKTDSGRASRLSTRAVSRSSPSRARAVRVVAAAGQAGSAGPRCSSGQEGRVAGRVVERRPDDRAAGPG